jgi:hypothetical protein
MVLVSESERDFHGLEEQGVHIFVLAIELQLLGSVQVHLDQFGVFDYLETHVVVPVAKDREFKR